jgi:hypothetical protein
MSSIISSRTGAERSSIKPNVPGAFQDGRERRELKFSYSTAGYDSYIKEGFTPPETHKRPDKFEYRFLNQVDIDQGKVKVEVTRMFRLRGIDYSTEKREKKEYLLFESNWYGKNWLGEELSVQHTEGSYREQTKVLRYDKPDPETGRVEAYYIKGQPREVYFIPFTKKKVDEILTGQHPFGTDSVNITDPEKVIYYGKFGDILGIPSFRCMDYTYEHFTTPEWTDFLNLAIRAGGPAQRKPKEQQDVCA